jgi:structural maintenance of chromosome 4
MFPILLKCTPLLQDDENFEPVPGTELVVSRRANRDNSSKYMINGKNSTFTEVTALLKGKGIDLDNNRFLILQVDVPSLCGPQPASKGDVAAWET